MMATETGIAPHSTTAYASAMCRARVFEFTSSIAFENLVLVGFRGLPNGMGISRTGQHCRHPDRRRWIGDQLQSQGVALLAISHWGCLRLRPRTHGVFAQGVIIIGQLLHLLHGIVACISRFCARDFDTRRTDQLVARSYLSPEIWSR